MYITKCVDSMEKFLKVLEVCVSVDVSSFRAWLCRKNCLQITGVQVQTSTHIHTLS